MTEVINQLLQTIKLPPIKTKPEEKDYLISPNIVVNEFLLHYLATTPVERLNVSLYDCCELKIYGDHTSTKCPNPQKKQLVLQIIKPHHYELNEVIFHQIVENLKEKLKQQTKHNLHETRRSHISINGVSYHCSKELTLLQWIRIFEAAEDEVLIYDKILNITIPVEFVKETGQAKTEGFIEIRGPICTARRRLIGKVVKKLDKNLHQRS